ncbi:MAG: tol-pal system protein YbgF [Gemmatimonadales bacterium]
MTKLGKVGLVALALLSSGACATKGDVAALRTSMVDQMREDRAQRDSLIAEIRSLRSVLLDSLNVATRRDISGRVDLERQIQDLNTALNQLMALTGETQRQLARLEAGGQGAMTVPGDESAGAVPAEGEAAASGTEARDLYDAAIRQFRRGSYETARTGLDEFLSRYPQDELAPDAQYYRAETYAESGDQEKALEEYARVLELYPNSRRAPTALYKSGRIELERGNTDDARTYFNRVIQGYPGSDEVELARRELTRLGG